MTEIPLSWKFGPVAKEQKRLASLLAVIRQLKAEGLTGSGFVGAYHARRVAPIMARIYPLYQMVPCIELAGTVMSRETIRSSEIRQRLKEDWTSFFLSDVPLPEHAARHEENRLAVEAK